MKYPLRTLLAAAGATLAVSSANATEIDYKTAAQAFDEARESGNCDSAITSLKVVTGRNSKPLEIVTTSQSCQTPFEKITRQSASGTLLIQSGSSMDSTYLRMPYADTISYTLSNSRVLRPY